MKSYKKISYNYYYAKMKRSFKSASYDYFLANRHRFVKPALYCALALSVIIGAGYRCVVLKERFQYSTGILAWNLSMASNFKRAPGRYSWEEQLVIQENPDEYVYTSGKSKYKPNAPMSSEIGWALILSLILKDGIKGVENIALHIVRYQVMTEIFIVILMFWVGKRVAGPTGACLAPLFYSIFKMPMVMMSDPRNYYWPILFSALSLFFWTVVYRPESGRKMIKWKYIHFFIYGFLNSKTRIQRKYVCFFIYGLLIGFATILRFYFLFLPLFFAPFIYIRERSLKKGVILLAILLLGQSVFVVPQTLYTKKYFGEYALTTRGHWHLFLQGLGFYENPWGIVDSGEINLNKWAIARGAPDMFKVPTKVSDAWYKKEYAKMFKEHPEIFIGNFLKHLKRGITLGTPDFQFFGMIDNHSPGMYRFMTLFPWMVLSAFLLLFIVARDQFWIGLAVILQGLYLLLVVVTWFPNYIPFMGGSIPAFTLLFAIAVAVHIRILLALMEASVRCWIYHKGIRTWPNEVVTCYRENWDKKNITMRRRGHVVKDL